MFILLGVDSHVSTEVTLFIDKIRWRSMAKKNLWFCHQFVDVESFITTVSDIFPKWFHKPMRQEIFVLVVCACAFLMELLLVSEVSFYSPKKKKQEIHSSENRWHCEPRVGFNSRLSSSGRNLHLPVLRLLCLNKNLRIFLRHLWMFGSGLDFWWDWL